LVTRFAANHRDQVTAGYLAGRYIARARIAPAGRETEVGTHDFHEIVDGRAVCTHHMEDWLSWFQQVGSWPLN
jgi:hypothetical protein